MKAAHFLVSIRRKSQRTNRVSGSFPKHSQTPVSLLRISVYYIESLQIKVITVNLDRRGLVSAGQKDKAERETERQKDKMVSYPTRFPVSIRHIVER